MTSAPIRYAIYTRQSVASDLVLSSCDVQFGICNDFIEAQQGPEWKWINERFDDAGISGAHTNRPALKRLMQRVYAGDVNKVAIYRFDRLTRNLRDSIEILETFRRHNVDLLIVTSPEIGSAATDKFVLNIMGAFAEFEREMIRSRLADSRTYRKKKALRLAGAVSYGYDADPATKQLLVNPHEAQRVKAIFKMASEGIRPRDIAAKINKRGWRTKSFVAKRSGKTHGGNLWTPRQVLDILANPVYTGVFADGKGTRPGTHKAIIRQSLYDQARQRITARRTSGKRFPAKGSQFVNLRGKVLCPKCGRIMSPHQTRKGNIVNTHYRCRSYAGGRPPCKGMGFRVYELEKAIADMLTDPKWVESILFLKDEEYAALDIFQAIWSLLKPHIQRRLLTEIVETVSFETSNSNLRVRLNNEAIMRIIRTHQHLSPRNAERHTNIPSKNC